VEEKEGIQESLTVVVPPKYKLLDITQIVKLWEAKNCR